ncbi:MAG: hypothetical protein QX198_03395 [Methylococcaceae bacterium]
MTQSLGDLPSIDIFLQALQGTDSAPSSDLKIKHEQLSVKNWLA